MNQPVYLKPWLKEWSWGIKIAIFIILISSVFQFAMLGLSQNFVVSYLGAQPEDITFSIQLTYVGIITMLPIQIRFIKRFELRHYLILVILSGAVLSFAGLHTTNIVAFFIIRFLEGLVVCMLSTSMLVLMGPYLKIESRQVVSSTIFYGTVLSSSTLVGVVAAQVSLNSDFKNLYNYMLLLQLTALVIVITGFRANSGMRKYPLYQIDWVGAVFLATFGAGLAYTILYGSKYYWYTDPRIVSSTAITLTAAVLFIYRELTVKRPMLNLSVFKSYKFWAGIILLGLYYGMKESINLIYGYTAGVLEWSAPQVISLALCSVTGLISTMILTARILIRKKNLLGFVIAGFTMLLVYHLWMYFIFTPDLAFQDLLLPVFFQGVASGLLFVPIMAFILSNIPAPAFLTGLTVAACTRFTSLINASAGFYNIELYFNQLFKESLLSHVTNLDDESTARLDDYKAFYQSTGFSADQAAAQANTDLARDVGLQSELLTFRATFLFIASIITIILAIAITVYLVKKYYIRKSGAVKLSV
jgi:DHA2 family multidrug resistance protein